MILDSFPQNTQFNIPTPIGCNSCSDNIGLDFDFTMAFQPIIDLQEKKIFAQEALVRGLSNESAGEILSKVTPQNKYKFDQSCRIKAVSLAASLEIDSFISINFLPNAVYRPENCLRTTIRAASENNFPIEKIIFEITEVEKLEDNNHLKHIVLEYKRHGFKTALDDFGSGYSGLNLLAAFQPDYIKIDMDLLRNIDQDRNRQIIVKNLVHLCRDLGIEIIAEGIETKPELSVLEDFGVTLFQGYYFAKPSFQSLAYISPELFL